MLLWKRVFVFVGLLYSMGRYTPEFTACIKILSLDKHQENMMTVGLARPCSRKRDNKNFRNRTENETNLFNGSIHQPSCMCCYWSNQNSTLFMSIVMNNTLFIVFQEPTDTGSNVHDKRNSHFPLPEHLLVEGFLCLSLQSLLHVVYLNACIGFSLGVMWPPGKYHDTTLQPGMYDISLEVTWL